MGAVHMERIFEISRNPYNEDIDDLGDRLKQPIIDSKQLNKKVDII